MSTHSTLLANGTQLTLTRAALPPLTQWTTRTTALLSVDGTQLTLALKARDHLGASADLAGTVLESESFMLLLVLAYTAHQQRLAPPRPRA